MGLDDLISAGGKMHPLYNAVLTDLARELNDAGHACEMKTVSKLKRNPGVRVPC